MGPAQHGVACSKMCEMAEIHRAPIVSGSAVPQHDAHQSIDKMLRNILFTKSLEELYFPVMIIR